MEICIEDNGGSPLWMARYRYANDDDSGTDYEHGSTIQTGSGSVSFSPPAAGGRKVYHFEVEYRGDALSTDGASGCVTINVTQGTGSQQTIINNQNVQNAYRHFTGKDSNTTGYDWGLAGKAGFGIYTTFDEFDTDTNADGFDDDSGALLTTIGNSNTSLMDVEGDGKYYAQMCLLFDNIIVEVERIGGDTDLDGDVDFDDYTTLTALSEKRVATGMQ